MLNLIKYLTGFRPVAAYIQSGVACLNLSETI
jgi:hypothetical protein